jgi:hypothetical protein
VHPRAVLERVGDEADLEQLDRRELAALRGQTKGAGAVAEAQPADRAARQQRAGARARVQRGDDPQAARVLLRGFDPADALPGPMLPKQRQRRGAPRQRRREGAGQDDVARGVGNAEQRGIAGHSEFPRRRGPPSGWRPLA